MCLFCETVKGKTGLSKRTPPKQGPLYTKYFILYARPYTQLAKTAPKINKLTR